MNSLTCRGVFRDLSALSTTPQTWIHIVPTGEHPGTIEVPAGYDIPGHGVAEEAMRVEGVTVLDAQTLERLVQAFDDEILIDADHLSHDLDKPTEAMGWGNELRYDARRNGLELNTRWTSPGREKIKDQVYRYISPEFDGAVRYEDNIFKFYPSALTGAGLTNRPKLKALRPVSANRTSPESTPSSTNTMNTAHALLCQILGIPETSTEDEVKAKAEAFTADLANSQNRAAEADALETEVKSLRAESLNRDLETFADVIDDKESATQLLQLNRDAAVKTFASMQARLTEKAAAKTTPIFQKNRATAPDGTAFASDESATAEQAAAHVAVVKNREKCTFETAWQIARAERPELFK